jgi:hypothetical protein
MRRKHPYFINIWIGLDQFVGTLFGIDADLTISGYVGYYMPGSRLERWIDWIFLKLTGETDHCLKNIEWDEVR